jgi:hypothetical protein
VNDSVVRLMVLVILFLTAIVTLFFTDLNKDKTVVYDCRLAEISPDFPAVVRDQCRQLRIEQYHEEIKKNMI